MHDEFGQSGFTSPDIVSVSKWFIFPAAREVPMTRPRTFSNFQPPLPSSSVRLLVIPLEYSPSLASMGAAITSDFVKALAESSPRTQVFNNQRLFYHITVFHTSHPKSIRPSPFEPVGGVIGGNLTSPSEETLIRELEALRDLLSSQDPPLLEIDCVLMTSGGTLIIAWINRDERVQKLRDKLRATFPGASSKQSTIIHTSLSRVVTEDGTDLPPPLAIHAVQQVCDRWTEKLKGRTFKPTNAWWVNETTFSTIEGPRTTIDFKT